MAIAAFLPSFSPSQPRGCHPSPGSAHTTTSRPWSAHFSWKQGTHPVPYFYSPETYLSSSRNSLWNCTLLRRSWLQKGYLSIWSCGSWRSRRRAPRFRIPISLYSQLHWYCFQISQCPLISCRLPRSPQKNQFCSGCFGGCLSRWRCFGRWLLFARAGILRDSTPSTTYSQPHYARHWQSSQ